MNTITEDNILMVMQKKGQVRVSDIASWLFTSNKQKVRRLLNRMVENGKLSSRKFKYIGNADICVYEINDTVHASFVPK